MYRNTILQLTLIDRIYERNFTILASVANGAEIASISIHARSFKYYTQPLVQYLHDITLILQLYLPRNDAILHKRSFVGTNVLLCWSNR